MTFVGNIKFIFQHLLIRFFLSIRLVKSNMSNTCSLSRFHGLPWETWTNAMGRTVPIEDKPEDRKEREKNKAGVMKLPMEDMKIFGLCPERDQFTVIVCEECNIAVKPQALLRHFELRHSGKDNHPPSQSVTPVPVPVKSTAKVVKQIVKHPPAKVRTKKTPTKDSSRTKENISNPVPSLPVSLTLEGPITDPSSSKGELPLHPVVALTPLRSSATPSTKSHNTVTTTPPKTRRPPRKHAPIKEREYDPDKHCGVVSAETNKPCTWSLTCKSHPMSLRRAVTGRSKPFDQLLVDHRQAKEALLKQKKNVELQQTTLVTPAPPPLPTVTIAVPEPLRTQVVEPPPVVLRLPELQLNVTAKNRLYLSSTPRSLVLKTVDKALLPPPPAPPVVPVPYSQPDVVAYTLNHPRALNAPMFSSHKIGGLVYSSRRMQIARQNLESCITRGRELATTMLMNSHSREIYASVPISNVAPGLSNVLNSMSNQAFQKNRNLKRSKPDKPAKSKKVCLGNDTTTSLINIQLSNLKSVLSRQFTNNTKCLPVASTANQFHIPNILSNALKRSAESSPQGQNKKIKKKASPIMSSVLTNHSKNGLTPNKPSVPFVRVAIANGKVEPESNTLGLCDAPKFANSNKLLNESELRKIGLRFEIFE